MITRGVGELAADPETCTDPPSIIIVVPLVALPPERIYDEGVDVVISSVRRSARLADIKTGSLIHQVLALREAKSKRRLSKPYFSLRTTSCLMASQATSISYATEQLLTPSRDAGIVEGITRGVILELSHRNGAAGHLKDCFRVSEIA